MQKKTRAKTGERLFRWCRAWLRGSEITAAIGDDMVEVVHAAPAVAEDLKSTHRRHLRRSHFWNQLS